MSLIDLPEYSLPSAPSDCSVRENTAGLHPSDIAFCVTNLLSPSESKDLIELAGPHMESTDAFFPSKIRKSHRAMFRAPALAQSLYARVLKWITPSDYRHRSPPCFGSGGVWVPHSINECVKIVRYDEGGHFAEHRDGPWVPREDQCSMFTLVVYLNDTFTGGGTHFLAGYHGSARIRSQRKNPELPETPHRTVVPHRGTALVFNHDLMHGGGGVLTGTKYILRTEIVFQRIRMDFVRRYAYLDDADYKTAVALYSASHAHLDGGNVEAFVATYQEVVAMQTDAMEARYETRRLMPQPFGGRLLPELWAMILDRVSGVDLAAMMRICRGMYLEVSSNQMLWERRFAWHFPKTYVSCPNTAWIDAYRARMVPLFIPYVVVPLEAGMLVTHRKGNDFVGWRSPRKARDYDVDGVPYHVEEIDPFLSTGYRPDHYTEPDDLRFMLTDSPATHRTDMHYWPVVAMGNVRWDALLYISHNSDACLDMYIKPFLIVQDVRWDAAYIAKATMEIFTSLRTPAVSFVHPVDLVLRAAARLFPSLHIKRVVLVKYSRPAMTWRDVDPPKDPWVVGFECEADAPYALLRTVWGVELSEAVQMEGSVCCDMLGGGFELLCRHPIVARLDMLAEAVIIGALPTFRDSCTFRLSVGM